MKHRIIALCITLAMLLSFASSMATVGTAASIRGKRLTGVKVYDAENNLTRESEYQYEGGFLTGILDRRIYEENTYEYSTTLTYDAAGRLASRISGDPDIPGMSAGTEYTYNDAGQMVSRRSWEGSSEEETYEYNAEGKRIHAVLNFEFGETITEYSYNEKGLLTGTTETWTNEWDGEVTTSTTAYSYDSQNRLIRESYSGRYGDAETTYSYQYQPFVLRESSKDYSSTELLLLDNSGLNLETFYLDEPEFFMDSEGYLAKVVDTDSYSGEVETYEFYYDGVAAETDSENPALFEGNLNEFMEQEAYQAYWASTVSDYRVPAQYAFIDINKDGNQELIICSDNEMGFYSFALFEYHKDTDQVTPLPIPAPGYEIHSCYGGLEYSDIYSAIVFTETNNGSAFGGLVYYSMKDGIMAPCFSIGFENYDGNGRKYHTAEEDSISEEKYFEYISESVVIEFLPIADFVPAESSAPSDEDSVELKAYTAFPESTIGTEQEVKIMFSLYVNGEQMPIEEYALEISNPSAIETTKTTDSDGSRIITFKGKAPGSSDLTFTENSTGISTTITVAVEDQCNYFRCSAFPTPYESIGSIYVDDYSCAVNDAGNHNIIFNAYNTSYAYGVVEVYDENGSLIRVVPLDPRSDGSGMEKVANGFKWVWEDIKDIFDGETPFYTKDSNAKHTPVKLENIPENAEIIISSDADTSDFVTLYTGVDVFVRTVSGAASIDLKTDGQVATVKELMNALVDSLIKSISHEEIENTIQEELIKEAAESISTSIAIASSADSVSDVYDTVYNLFQSLDIDAESIMLNVLKGMGYGVADTVFTTVVPAYKFVNLVDLILETAWPFVDYQFNLDRGKMEIHVSKHGLQNFVVNSCVTVTQRSNFGDSTVLDAYEVVEDAELSDLSDSIPAELTNYTVYNITLREAGAETQPNSEIEVRLPVPNNIDAEKCVVYRIEGNNAYTQMQSSVDDGYITFKTTHLSYYVIGQLSDAVALAVEDGLQPNYWGIIGVGALVLVSITFVVMLTKRKKTGK